jgi:hypothetical protein
VGQEPPESISVGDLLDTMHATMTARAKAEAEQHAMAETENPDLPAGWDDADNPDAILDEDTVLALGQQQ